MKQWVKKLLNQFDNQAENSESSTPHAQDPNLNLSEDRATLLYVIDIFSKNLIEVDTRPVRKVREIFDEFAKGLLVQHAPTTEKLLFRFRQFFSSYRIQEYTYIQKTFTDFKSIVWDFADQLNESIVSEQSRDEQVRESLNQLREAVEADSIDELKSKSREFIDFYIELQNRNDESRRARLEVAQKNLETVKQKLVEVNDEARRDHLTSVFNRKSFDEFMARSFANMTSDKKSHFLIAFDIDYFKKINDIFGHDAGDHVLKYLASLLQKNFSHLGGFVARMGGEEFCAVLTCNSVSEMSSHLDKLLATIRKEVIVFKDTQIRLTISAGVAQLQPPSQEIQSADKIVDHSPSEWLKRADVALYKAKNSGRDKYCFAESSSNINRVA